MKKLVSIIVLILFSNFTYINKTVGFTNSTHNGITDEILLRQSFKESTFNQYAVSEKGCKGLTQIGNQLLQDYYKKVGYEEIDLFNPNHAIKIQKFAMDELYNSSFINKPNQLEGVRIAKTLAAYNWGRGNLSKYLVNLKKSGVDIYNSYDWIDNLPKETKDYINKILFKKNDSFNQQYYAALNDIRYKNIIDLYQTKEYVDLKKESEISEKELEYLLDNKLGEKNIAKLFELKEYSNYPNIKKDLPTLKFKGNIRNKFFIKKLIIE